MIKRLELRDVGPARALDFDFAPRLNLLTGDNGLGKTFVLDVLWWVMTGGWAGDRAWPWRGGRRPPGTSPETSLKPHIRALGPSRLFQAPGPAAAVDELVEGTWLWDLQRWTRGVGARTADTTDGAGDRIHITDPSDQDLVVYARIDGSFAVWDGRIARFDSQATGTGSTVFDPKSLWFGRDDEVPGPERVRTVIRGLLEDWVSWQNANGVEFRLLCEVLHALSEPDIGLEPARPTRVRLDDRKDIPTLALPYGEVPVTLASAGIKRILGLAYVLVWAWSEHLRAAELTNRPPTNAMVVLIDEVELHLHPRWQRSLLPAVLAAVRALSPELSVQVFATTHAPMVLASVETLFDEEQDDLFLLELDGRVVRAEELRFTKEGDATSWLSSAVFGGVGGRSREGEFAVEAAMAFMQKQPEIAEQQLAALQRQMASVGGAVSLPSESETPLVERIHAALAATVPAHDDVWAQWSLVYRPGRRGAAKSG